MLFVIKQYVPVVDPPPRYISPLEEFPILMAPVPLPFRDIPVFVVPAVIDGESPAKVSFVEVKVLELITPESVMFPPTFKSFFSSTFPSVVKVPPIVSLPEIVRLLAVMLFIPVSEPCRSIVPFPG